MASRPAGAVVYMVSILVIALALGGGWWAAALRPDARPPLTSALDVLPVRTNVVGFTDWAQVRRAVGLDTVDTADERDELQDTSATRDLSTRSAIGRAVEEMHDVLGWSPADVEWETYGQDPGGAANVVRLDGSISFDTLRDKLRAAGYTQDGETWSVAKRTVLPDITKVIALVPRQRLVVMSDVAARVPEVLDVVHGRARSLASSRAAAGTAQALAGSDSLLMQGGVLGCESTAVTGGEREEQAQAAIESAGSLEPYSFSGRGIVDRGGSGFAAQQVVFAMAFDSAAVASEQARTRARLGSGPFIGRNGPTSETLRLKSARADAATVRLAFAHDPDTDVFMTGTGPVLFAACSA